MSPDGNIYLLRIFVGLTQGPGQPGEAAETSQPVPPLAKQRRTELAAHAPPTPGYSSVAKLQEEEEVQEVSVCLVVDEMVVWRQIFDSKYTVCTVQVVGGRVKVEPGAGQQMVAAGAEYQDSYQEFPEEYGEEGGEASQYYTDTDTAGVAGTSQLSTTRTWELGTAFIDHQTSDVCNRGD